MTSPTTKPTHPRTPALLASALVILALILIQAQTLVAQPFGGNAAQAGMVSQSGQMTVLTADAGTDDLLVVLEGRSEELMVYRTDRNGTQLQQRLRVPKLFEDARAMALGR